MAARQPKTTEVFIISCKLKITKLADCSVVDNWNSNIFTMSTTDIMSIPGVYIDHDMFDNELHNLFEFAQSNGIKMSGQIIVFQRNKGDNNIAGRVAGKYDISNKEISYEMCDINVSVKSNKQASHKLTEEEKQALFTEFWTQTQRIPRPTEKYKEFNIGGYFHGARKNKELFDRLNSLMIQ